MIPFVLQTTAQKKNARIAKFLTLQKQAKADHRENNICLWRKNDKYINKTKQKSVRLRSNVFLSTDKSNHNGGLKGKCWRHARLNVTWHRLCSGSNQEITSSASLVARAAYETNVHIYMFLLCKRISLE